MIKSIDLNCDLGESYGLRSNNVDHDIMPFISSCNIACGFHSGDPLTIEKTISMAVSNKVSIGAHPSFPDLQGFGRRNMVIEFDELKAIVKYQIAALKGMVESQNAKLNHVKPHGALYNMAANDAPIAEAICKAIVEIDDSLILYGLSKSILAEAALSYNITFCNEVFADRVYEQNLSLRSRKKPNAVISNPEQIMVQIDRFVHHEKVLTFGGEEKDITVETVCLHSDTKGAVLLAKKISEFLVTNHIQIEAPKSF